MLRNKFDRVAIGLKSLLPSPRRRLRNRDVSVTPQFDSLEPRLLFSADFGLQFTELTPAPASPDDTTIVAADQTVSESFGLDDAFLAENDLRVATLERFTIQNELDPNADQLSVDVSVNGQLLTLELERGRTSRSDDFTVLLQVEGGGFEEFQVGSEGVFVGEVAGWPGLTVNAVVSSRGLSAEAYYADGRLAWTISPTDEFNAAGESLHIADTTDIFNLLESLHDHDGDGIADHGADEHGPHPPGCGCAACCGVAVEPASVTAEQPAATVGAAATPAVGTGPNEFAPLEIGVRNQTASDGRTLVPNNPASRAVVTTPVEVREVVIGFDVTNEAFREGYNNNVQAVLDNISLFLNTNERVNGANVSPNTIFLRDSLVHQVAGLIVIRTDVNSDPYADSDGDADVNGDVLTRFRDRWNSNADTNNANLERDGDATRSQSNHGLATLLAGSAGSADGLAFVGTVNETNRYSIADGSQQGFWRAVARHEIGHTYGLSHFGDSNRRAEFDSNGNGLGIFDPTGLRNRLTTDELTAVRAEILSSNLPLINPNTPNEGTFTEHQVRPRPNRDDVVFSGRGSLVIDVLANDFDANNDALFIQRFDGTTEQGGTVEVTLGTGDQGQDELVYTPPEGFTGTDSFFYFAGEAVSGPAFTAFALVTIEVQGETTVDPNQSIFFYDLGTADSPLFDGNDDPYQRLTEQTFGDLSFESETDDAFESFDRGASPGVNAINRDGIRISRPTTFRHALSDGIYDVWFTVADTDFSSDPFLITAEDGSASVTTPAVSAGTSPPPNVFLRNVAVVDGELTVDFEGVEADFAASFSRIIIMRVGEAPTTVDVTQPIFFYDLGTLDSPLFDGNDDPYQRLTDATNGDLSFQSQTDGAFESFDRGASPGVNAINRDGIRISRPTTFRHALSDGIYDVWFTVADTDFSSDPFLITAEGGSASVTTPAVSAGASPPPNVFLRNVTVVDGELTVDFEGVEADFAASFSRIIIMRVGEAPTTVDVTQPIFFYDLGTFDSPLFDDNDDPYQRLTDATNGDLGFTSTFANAFESIDRGATPGVNDINRDSVRVSAPTSFHHAVEDGIYNVLFTVFDTDVDSDPLQLTAEGEVSLTTDAVATTGAAVNFTLRDVTVTDGELNVDIDGVDADFAASLTRIIVTRVADLPGPDATVVSRNLFYAGSDLAENSIDDAIATNILPLITGQATFENYSSFSGGLNGLIIDLADAGDLSQIDVSDFTFRVGNSNDLSTFVAAPTPDLEILAGAGIDGSDRLVLTWADRAITTQWLQVTIAANDDTGLAAEDVFYFGNAIGETGNSATDARVDVFDVGGIRNNPTGRTVAEIDNPYDINRDGRVDVFDINAARQNPSGRNPLILLSIPGSSNLSAVSFAATSSGSDVLASNTSSIASSIGIAVDFVGFSTPPVISSFGDSNERAGETNFDKMMDLSLSSVDSLSLAPADNISKPYSIVEGVDSEDEEQSEYSLRDVVFSLVFAEEEVLGSF